MPHCSRTNRWQALFSILWIFAASTVAQAWEVPGDPLSRKYSEVQKILENIQKTHPQTSKLITLGMNDTGELISGLQIGFQGPHAMVVSTHHGNEYGSTEVALALAGSLAESPLPGRKVTIIPVLNVSGYNKRMRQELGHDPNRDYPGPCGSEGPFKLRSTKALADFIATENVVVSATLHTAWPAVLYPWGFATQDLSTPYDGLYKQLGAAATEESKYDVGNSTEMLYAANGAYEDYAFLTHGAWSLLFELGHTHTPDLNEIKTLREVNVPGIRRYLANAPQARAPDHAFQGHCDAFLATLDRHEE